MSNEEVINQAWEERESYSATTEGPIRYVVEETLAALDNGTLRVAEKLKGEWVVHHWLKKAVLLSFILNPFSRVATQNDALAWWDKVPSKFSGWNSDEFSSHGFRAVPGTFVRHSAYIAPNVVLMPSFVNVGAHIGSGTMIDTWATVGSCAQVGKNCHISGGTGIGGVLEPLQANPVIIEDNCFIGARSEVVEGVIVEEGAVLSMGGLHWSVNEDLRCTFRPDIAWSSARVFGSRTGYFTDAESAKCRVAPQFVLRGHH